MSSTADIPGTVRPRAFRRDRRLLDADGFAWAVMTGCGETCFVAFGLAAGLGEVTSGLLATVPLLIGAVAQLATPWGLRRVGSLRRWVAGNAAIQACSLLPLVLMADRESVPAWALFTLASVYWASGLATAPAWNTWITTLVPAPVRARYFAHRSRLVQLGLIAGMAVGGVLLQWGRGGPHELRMFAAVFLVAFFARAISSMLLRRQSDAPAGFESTLHLPSRRTLAPFLRAGRGRLVLLYMLAVTMSVQVSGPYFTAYLLEHLDFGYLELMSIFGCTVASKVVFLPAIGRYAKAHGPVRLLWIGGLAITPAATLWLVSGEFWYLFCLQFAVGAGWACWEMATFLLVFDTIEERERASVLTLFNFANAIAIVAGSLLGALVLRVVGVGALGYATLFGVTGAMRVVTLFMLAAVSRAGSGARLRSGGTMALQTLSPRPGASSIDLPIIDGRDEEQERFRPDPLAARTEADRGRPS
ncbi:MAG: MFS transporter [Phycisphaerales bacterium]|jgi:MFS family permease|nr:MFS transporter [Planctomycetota bacterium]